MNDGELSGREKAESIWKASYRVSWHQSRLSPRLTLAQYHQKKDQMASYTVDLSFLKKEDLQRLFTQLELATKAISKMMAEE